MKNKNVLMLFAKKPLLGQVKTRLAKTIGKVQALSVYKQLLSQVIKNVVGLTYDKWLFWDSAENNDVTVDFLNLSEFREFQQQGIDLGERLKKAFAQAFEIYDKVVVIGSDCPFVDGNLICDALDMLNRAEVVIGPALDGGYYLLGMKVFYPELLENIDWGTELVYIQTMDQIKKLQLSYDILPCLSDIDMEADLQKLK